MMTNANKTPVTPEMAEEIKAEFELLIDFWLKKFNHSNGLDRLALERLGLIASEVEAAGLSYRSKETKHAKSTRETLVFLLGMFERSLESGELYLEDESEFYAKHIHYRQEGGSENKGIIRGYVTAQDIIKAYL